MLAQQMTNNPQWIKLVIIAIFAGSGVIRWAYVKLQEQAAKKRAMDQAAAGRVEELRTGRPAEPDVDRVAVERATVERATVEQQAAAKRQAQIEEFRRRQQERAAQRAGRSQPAPAAAPKPAPKPVAKQRPAPTRGPKRVVEAAMTPEELRKEQAEVPRVAPTPGAKPAPLAAFTRPASAEEWRKVIVANTVLGKAVGLGSGGESWGPLF